MQEDNPHDDEILELDEVESSTNPLENEQGIIILIEGWPVEALGDIDLQACSIREWEEIFTSLNPREQRILTLRYEKSLSFEKIAKREGEIKGIKNVVRAALKKIKAALHKKDT